MADNLKVDRDIVGWYETSLLLQDCMDKLTHDEDYHDEFMEWLKAFTHEHSIQFNDYVKKHNRYSNVKREKVALDYKEFLAIKKKEYERIQQYQDSRPDLYN